MMDLRKNEELNVTYNKGELPIVESEEIEGYASCSSVKQRCMTDCAWPLQAPVMSFNE